MLLATVFDWLYHAARWTWHDPDGYNFISGPLADITLLGGGYALLRHHNCHVGGCWRIGRRAVEGTSYVVCKKHHPRTAPSAAQVHDEHAEHHRWLDERRRVAAAAAKDVRQVAHEATEIKSDIEAAVEGDGSADRHDAP